MILGGGGSLETLNGNVTLTTQNQTVVPVVRTSLTRMYCVEYDDRIAVLECGGFIPYRYRLSVHSAGADTTQVQSIERELLEGGAGGGAGHVALVTSDKKHLYIWGMSGEGCYVDRYQKRDLTLNFSFHTAH